MDKDAAEGGCLTPQVAQRPAGLLFGFDSSLHPFRLKPAFRPLLELSSEDRLVELRKPEIRQAVLEQDSAAGNVPGMNALVTEGWDRMFPLGTPPVYEPGPEDSIAAKAKAAGKTPAEYAYDLMLEGEFIYMPILGYANGSLEDIKTMMEHEKAVFSVRLSQRARIHEDERHATRLRMYAQIEESDQRRERLLGALPELAQTAARLKPEAAARVAAEVRHVATK